jgi:hypothetical protein
LALTRGTHKQWERREEVVPIRKFLAGPRAEFRIGPERFPRAFFNFFLSLFLFLFSFWFLHNFWFCYSNEFKPKSQVF